MRKLFFTSLLAIVYLSPTFAFASDRVALIIAGAVTMLTSKNDKQLYTTGLLVMLFGTFSMNDAHASQLNGPSTALTLVNDNSTPGQNYKMSANLGQVLQETEMEAMYLASSRSTQTASVLSEYALANNLSPQLLGQIIISGKSFADSKLDSQQFGSQRLIVSSAELAAKTGTLNSVESKVLRNYLQIRNIVVQ